MWHVQRGNECMEHTHTHVYIYIIYIYLYLSLILSIFRRHVGAYPPSLESRTYPREIFTHRLKTVVSGQGTCELRLKRDFFFG